MPHDIVELRRLAEKAFSNTERRNAEARWEELAEYLLPSQSGTFSTNFIGSTKGDIKTGKIFDSEGEMAARDLAAAIHSTLTNPATRWSKMRFRNEALNNDTAATEWLNEVTKTIHEYLNDSNFDNQIAKNYQAYTVFGNMILLQESKAPKSDSTFGGFRFSAIHLAQCAWLENDEGIVDTIYRKFEMTAKQIYDRWPDSSPKYVIEKMEREPDCLITVYHCIKPRKENEVKFNSLGIASAKNRPFGSYYFLAQEDVLLEEDGYYEFPVFVVRWNTAPAEAYGRGPGHLALPTVKTHNKATKLLLDNAAKSVGPSYLTTQRNILGSLDIRPNGVTVVRDARPESFRELTPNQRFDVSQLLDGKLVDSIKKAFFLDKLLLPPRENTGEMTAFEISQRVEQMQRVLGPTLSRLNSEFLSPLIVRSFRMLLRANALPPLPESLEASGVDVDVVFVNQLARSQQIEDITNLQQLVQVVGLLAQLKPNVVDNINADAAVRHAAKVIGVDESTMTNRDEVDKIREQRAERAAEERQATLQQTQADAAAKMSKSER